MDDYPKVIYKEINCDTNESNATKVERILNRIDDLNGEEFTYLNMCRFESIAVELINYVTLIRFEIRPKVFKTKPKPDDEELLVYYYNEDMVHIQKMYLMITNGFTNYSLYDLAEYKAKCINSNRCLVYDIDDRYGDKVFNLNYELSNPGYVVDELLNKIDKIDM
jgi:hypothetical protein